MYVRLAVKRNLLMCGEVICPVHSQKQKRRKNHWENCKSSGKKKPTIAQRGNLSRIITDRETISEKKLLEKLYVRVVGKKNITMAWHSHMFCTDSDTETDEQKKLIKKL